MSGTIRRSVFGTDGTAYNITLTEAGIEIREPRQKGFLVPWGVIYQHGAELEARRLRAERGAPKITRGLLTTR